VDALVDGFVIALLYGAARGRPSPGEAASGIVPRLPSLVGARVIVATIFVVPSLSILGVHSTLWWWPTFVLQLYVLYVVVRLALWREAIVVEAAGLARAARRSWELARGNWWRLAFLVAITWWGAAMLLGPLPVYVSVPAGALLQVLGEAVMASAYLQRVGILPRRRPRLAHLAAAHAAERSGVEGL